MLNFSDQLSQLAQGMKAETPDHQAIQAFLGPSLEPRSGGFVAPTWDGPDQAGGHAQAFDVADSAIGTPQIVDGAVGNIKIADGAVGITKFASGIVPPRVVTELPTLPDALYPPTSLVVLDDSDDPNNGKLFRNVANVWTAAIPLTDVLNLIVATLPDLPNAAYPDGSPVVLTSDGKVYRNHGGAWVKSTDGADLVANSVTAAKIAAGTITASEIAALTITAALIAANTITAGQIAAGAIGADQIAANAITTAKLAAACVIANVLNVGGTVEISATGITLKDASGATVLTSAGFSGAWADFMSGHVYNGNFAVGTLGSLPMWQGTGDQAPYKINLPFWLPWTGSPFHAAATYAGAAGWPSEHVVGLTFGATGSATSNNASLSSDPFPIIPSGRISVRSYRAMTVPAGVTLNRLVQFDFFTAAQVWISESHLTNAYTSSFSAAVSQGPDVMAPANARFAQLTISCWETVAHSASTEYDIGAFWVTLATAAGYSSLDDVWDGGGAGGTTGGVHVGDTTANYQHGILFGGPDAYLYRSGVGQLNAFGANGGTIVNSGYIAPAGLTGNTNNWNPGATLPAAAVIDMTSNGAYNLTGMVAGTDKQRIFLWNDSGFSITLKHNSASSSAGNKFYCPNASDVVIRTYGSVDLLYYAGFWLPLGA